MEITQMDYGNMCIRHSNMHHFAVVVVVMATARQSSAATVDIVLAVYVVDRSLLDRPAAVRSSWTPAVVHHNASPDRRRRVHVY